MSRMDKKRKRELIKLAGVKSLPILCSYLFVAMAYGMMMQEAGYAWYWSLAVSLTVYTGAFQFVLITFFSAGASLAAVTLTALLMNSRQAFYSLTYLEDFRQMGKRKPYMIHTMTDETYAVNGTLGDLPDADRREAMFWLALFSRCYWMTGAVLGGVIGQLLPFQTDGIDFCMTALFLIIFIDQWERMKSHRAALTGLACGIICLLVFGANRFMLPALIITSGLLMVLVPQQTGSKLVSSRSGRNREEET